MKTESLRWPLLYILCFTLLFPGGCATQPVALIIQENLRAQDEIKEWQIAYQTGLYDEAITKSRRLLERYSDSSFTDEIRWMLAKSYEAKGELVLALTEYKTYRTLFSQSAHAQEAIEKIAVLERRVPDSERAKPQSHESQEGDYRIAKEDELEISVYGDKDLVKTQLVRPDGKIAFPLVGEVRAAGITSEELKATLMEGLAKYLRNPRVTVLVTKYSSKPVYVLGEVKKPGFLSLSPKGTVLEAISRAEGLADTADLQGAFLVRDEQIVTVNFESLFRHGDYSQNLALQPRDVIYIPSIAARKLYVLGEVKTPQVLIFKPGMTVIESVAAAGGLTKDAIAKEIVLIRGGLTDPHIVKVDFEAITEKGELAKNLPLQQNDIVYVPKTMLVTAERYVNIAAQVAQTVFFTAFSISLYPSVKAAITGDASSNTAVLPTGR
jgi:polysaccharide export outer membrane protein